MPINKGNLKPETHAQKLKIWDELCRNVQINTKNKEKSTFLIMIGYRCAPSVEWLLGIDAEL